METNRDRKAVKHEFKLLIIKTLLGAVAAIAAMALMRVVGHREVLVALFIGLVPGIVEKSPRKMIYGLIFAGIGYGIGGRISARIAKSVIEEVPFGHWAIVGGFIGLTAGISRRRGQWFSFRFIIWSLGATLGFVCGLIFGFMGDIGGFLTIFAIPPEKIALFYYMREVSLLCAGIFINLGAAVASIFAFSLDNGLWRVARAVEKVES